MIFRPNRPGAAVKAGAVIPPAITNISLSNASLAENSALGVAIGTLSATGGTAPFTFGLTDSASNRVRIVGSALQVGTTPSNFEAATTFSIGVNVTDVNGVTYYKPLTITVTNLNEAPTDITLSAATLAENSVEGTAIGTLGFVDPDAGATGTFSLVDSAGSRFKIVGTALQAGSVSADYEDATSHAITVRVTDQGGLIFDEVFTITVTDVADTAVPVATIAPSITLLSPIVGKTVNVGSGLSRGTWSGSPTSYIDDFKVDGVVKTLPYTFVTGDATKAFTFGTQGVNAGGPGVKVTSPASNTILAAAPAGSVHISEWDPTIHNPVNVGSTGLTPGPYILYKGERYYADTASEANYKSKAGRIVSLDNDWIKFTTYPGDVMNTPGFYTSDVANGAERNTLTERAADARSPTDDMIIEFDHYVEGNDPFTHRFRSIFEDHVYGPSIAQMMELVILGNGRYSVTGHHRNAGGSEVTRNGMWTDSAALLRGVASVTRFKIEVRPSPTDATKGRIVLTKNGVVVLNFVGLVGFSTTTSRRTQFGIYRGDTPDVVDTTPSWIRLISKQFGANGTLTMTAPPAPTYGANKFSDPEMATGAEWSAIGGSKALAGGRLVHTSTVASGDRELRCEFTDLTIGWNYEFEVEIAADSVVTGSTIARASGYDGINWNQYGTDQDNATTTPTVKVISFTATSSTFIGYVQNVATASGAKVSVDKAKLRRVT